MFRFSATQLDALRSQYAQIATIDPCQPTYDKLVASLAKLSLPALRQLAAADIRFVSRLALNRVARAESVR